MELWDAAQEIRGKHPPVPERTRHVNALSGLVYCHCGGCMSRRQYKSQGVERCKPRLLCVNQTQCGTASCTVEEMIEEVSKVLRQTIADMDLLIQQGPSEQEQIQKQLIDQLEKRLLDLEEQEYSVWDKYTQEGMPRHIFEKLKVKIAHQRQETQQALDAARQAAPTESDYANQRQTLHTALELLQDPDASVRETNLLLKKCIKRITYNRQKKDSPNRRFGTPSPISLDIELNF